MVVDGKKMCVKEQWTVMGGTHIPHQSHMSYICLLIAFWSLYLCSFAGIAIALFNFAFFIFLYLFILPPLQPPILSFLLLICYNISSPSHSLTLSMRRLFFFCDGTANFQLNLVRRMYILNAFASEWAKWQWRS